jgi:hypothetical protein
MITNDFFRLSLDQAVRNHKKSPIFRHVLFACAELHDPLEPDVPFTMQAPLPEIEKEWHFRRDEGVPAWIKLYVGRAARERALAKLIEEYSLPPAERFKRIECSIKIKRYDVDDVDTWDIGFFCVIWIPEYNGDGTPFVWCGNRDQALTDPRIRPWFFDARAKLIHGNEAVEIARRQFSRTRGLR